MGVGRRGVRRGLGEVEVMAYSPHRLSETCDPVKEFYTGDPVEDDELSPEGRAFMEALEARLRRQERSWYLEWRYPA